MKVLDMHCDTVSELLEKRRRGQEAGLLENSGHLDLKRMKESGYLLQNFALFVENNGERDPWEEVCALYQVYTQEIEANRELIAPVLRYGDIASNEAAGRMSAMLTVEEGGVCKGEIARLHRLYEMGVRMLTLTWNFPNELGHPNLNLPAAKIRQASGEKPEQFLFVPDTEHGLTKRGREFAEEMQRLGMIVDVSHLSDQGFYDVLECTGKPFVASHSNARTVCGCVRNLTDDMLRKLGERGGCTGLNYCVDFLLENAGSSSAAPDAAAILEAVVKHAVHITSVGGIESLGLGSDFDGIETNPALPGAESMPVLWEALHRAGFTQSQLDKIFRENVMRVYRDTLA